MQLTNICLIISYTIPEDRRTQSHRAESLKSRTVDPFLSFSLPFFDYTWPQQLVPCLSSSSNFIITTNTRYRISLIHSIPHQTHTNTHPHTHSHVTRHSVCDIAWASYLLAGLGLLTPLSPRDDVSVSMGLSHSGGAIYSLGISLKNQKPRWAVLDTNKGHRRAILSRKLAIGNCFPLDY
jgi:hypothetical protein